MIILMFLVPFLAPTFGSNIHDILDVEPSDITYIFYNRANPNGTEVTYDQASEGNFDADLPTFFFIHGWIDYCKTGSLDFGSKKPLLEYHDVNIVSVCWEKWSNTEYLLSSTKTLEVGQFVGEFILQLASDYNFPLSKLTIVGHSLGAHVAGHAGAATNGSIGRIVGLDPAGPNFFESDPSKRLDPTDARYVEAIHSNAGLLGLDYDVGHADFWPNVGQYQPGCFTLDVMCNHLRSIDLYVESIGQQNNFVATKCESYDDFTKGECPGGFKSLMAGVDFNTAVEGDYYLTTNSAPPYAVKDWK